MPNNLEIILQGIHRPVNKSLPPVHIPKLVMVLDQVGELVDSDIQTIGISEETLGISSDIGDLGLAFIMNLDDTNYVDIGFSTGVYGIRLYPKKWNLLTLMPTPTLYCLANTAAVNLAYKVYEL